MGKLQKAETEIVERVDPREIDPRDRMLIDAQIATAQAMPRDPVTSLQEAMALATSSEDVAASMFYALPRDGKTIEGPSARLAELVAYCWGNMRLDAQIVDEGKTHVTAEGTCHDLQKNIAIRTRIKRRITTKSGKRYGADMIGTTSNAAISIALRNACFKVVPMALVRPIYEAARQRAVGDAGQLEQNRQKAFGWFAKTGIDEAALLGILQLDSLEDVGVPELATVRGLAEALKSGETTVEAMLGSEGAAELEDSKAAKLNAKIAAKREPAKTSSDGENVKPEPERQAAEPEPAADQPLGPTFRELLEQVAAAKDHAELVTAEKAGEALSGPRGLWFEAAVTVRGNQIDGLNPHSGMHTVQVERAKKAEEIRTGDGDGDAG